MMKDEKITPQEDLTEEQAEFLHKMYEETFDFDEWADSIDLAIENGEIEEAQQPKTKEIEIEFDLDDMF